MRKTDIPLKKEYVNIEDLPSDVQELPGSGSLYWLHSYNFGSDKGFSKEKSKDFAWKKVKRRYYMNKKGIWRPKMKDLDDCGSFQGQFLAKVRKGKSGAYYIEGKASDTSIDLEDDQMSSEFVQKMQDTAEGLNMYVDHDHSLDKTVGVIVKSSGDENEFFIKGRLESPETNPHVQSIINKGEAGIKLAFSIGGRILKATKRHSEEIGRTVRQIKDGILCEISVTTMPANINTGAQVSLAKSMSKALDDLEDEGIFDSDIDDEFEKILSEMFELDQIQRAIYNLTWTYIDLIYKIVNKDDMDGAAKKDKIKQISDEFADTVEKISDRMADLIADQNDFLEESEAA